MFHNTAITSHPAAQPLPRQAVGRALDFLRRQTVGNEFPSAQASLNRGFLDPFSCSQVRERICQRFGVDTGFDLGAECFSAMQALILTPPATGEADLIAAAARQTLRSRRGRRYAFFPENPMFPADTDCTAIAAAGLYRHGFLTKQELLLCAHDLIAAAAPTGAHDQALSKVVTVYWQDVAEPKALSHGHKQDPLVCANVMHTLHLAGISHTSSPGQRVLAANLAYIHNHLTSGRYVEGTRYYPTAEAFIHAASRFTATCQECASVLGQPLRQALARLIVQDSRSPRAPIDLALLIAAADELEITSGQDSRRARLVGAQRADGSWLACPYFRMGRVPVYFGSPQLTTLFALTALRPS